jgi:hypothetical protein
VTRASSGRPRPSAPAVALGLTLVAGCVAVLRQAGEARAVRAGLRPPTGPVGTPEPAGRTGPLARRVAAWVPARPSTPLGRAAAACWAAPLTAVGFAVALAGGRVPRRDTERDCWVAVGVGGPSRTVLGAVGAAANTIGRVVVVRGPGAGPALLDHEAVHVRQAERLGPLLPVAYAWLGARYGYADNPLERAARTGARRADALRRARAAG